VVRGGKISWQLPPLATRAMYIADCVEHLAHVCLALAPPVRAGGIIGSMLRNFRNRLLEKKM